MCTRDTYISSLFFDQTTKTRNKKAKEIRHTVYFQTVMMMES